MHTWFIFSFHEDVNDTDDNEENDNLNHVAADNNNNIYHYLNEYTF